MAYNVWTSEVLYPAPLNENFSLITAVLHSITDGQMAAGAIGAGTLIAPDVVDETHLDYADTVNGIGCLQIGKDRTTFQQMLLKGTFGIAAENVTNKSVTITYANADCATGGEPNFVAVPHVYVTAYTADTGMIINIQAVGTDTCLVYVNPSVDAGTFAAQWILYWEVVGNF